MANCLCCWWTASMACPVSWALPGHHLGDWWFAQGLEMELANCACRKTNVKPIPSPTFFTSVGANREKQGQELLDLVWCKGAEGDGLLAVGSSFSSKGDGPCCSWGCTLLYLPCLEQDMSMTYLSSPHSCARPGTCGNAAVETSALGLLVQEGHRPGVYWGVPQAWGATDRVSRENSSQKPLLWEVLS